MYRIAMRIIEIICEATPGQLLKKPGLPEKLEQLWLQEFGQKVSAEEIMNKLSSLAPAANVNTYIEWLVKLFIHDNNFDITEPNVKNIIQTHFNNRQHLQADPMSYGTFDDMEADIKRYQEESGKSSLNRTKKREGEKSGISGEGVKTIIPGKMYLLDQEAAEKFGAETWCISNPKSRDKERYNLFRRYSNYESEPFYMLTLPEMDPRYSKIGIFPGEHGQEQFQDRMNETLSSREIHQIWREYPEIYEKMRPEITNKNWYLPEEQEAEMLTNKNYRSLDVINYILDNKNGERWPEYEEVVKTQPESAVDYAAEIIQGRFEEAEPYIMKDPYSAQRYASTVLETEWPEAEKYIKQELEAALFYAQNIKGPWPEVEELIKTDPEAAAYYAEHVLRDRWPEAEEIINSDPYAKSAYQRFMEKLNK